MVLVIKKLINLIFTNSIRHYPRLRNSVNKNQLKSLSVVWRNLVNYDLFYIFKNSLDLFLNHRWEFIDCPRLWRPFILIIISYLQLNLI